VRLVHKWRHKIFASKRHWRIFAGGAGSIATPLSGEQRKVLRDVLNTPDSLTNDGDIQFKKIYKILEQRGHPRPDGRSLNLERASREQLRGNTTLKAFKRMELLEPWSSLEDKHQTAVVNLLADLGSPEQLDRDDWHQGFLRAGAKQREHSDYRHFAPEVIAFVDLLRANPGFGRLSAMNLEGGRMAYSVKALNRLTAWLHDPSWKASPGSDARVDEQAAIRECYPEQFVRRQSKGLLSPPPVTGNDTVDVALRQVHWVVADAIRTLGSPPSEIIVEFGREVGLGAAKRNDWEKISSKNQRLRTQARNEIASHGHTGSNVAIRRYLHWQEQSTHCPYCEKPVTLNDALDGQATHVDHIIPRSLTQVGRKRSEVVLAHAACNVLKGNRTPWQAFGGSDKWAVIEQRAKDFEKKKQYRKARLLQLKDFEQEVLTDASIAEFADRQMHQTAWIARDAAQWLSGLCANVFAARGEFTAMMRRSWHLDTVIPEVRYELGRAVLDTEGKPISKEQFGMLRPHWEGHGRAPDVVIEKRLDHRHHVVDALVIALCSRRTYQKLAANYKAALELESGSPARPPKWQAEPPLTDIRGTALRMVRECRISHKADRHLSGKLFQDTAYAEVRIHGQKECALASRTSLASLADEKSPDKTRENIACVASAEVRGLVLAEFERRLAQGETPKQAFSRAIDYPKYGTKIHSVRVVRKDVSLDKAKKTHFASRAGNHSKLLVSDGNACLDVAGTGKTFTVRVVPMHDAVATRQIAAGSTVTRRFFKSDTVIDSKDTNALVVRQIKAVGGGTLILTPVYESRPVRELKAIDGLKTVTGSALQRLVHANVVPSSITAGGSAIPRD
jgi:CRISPR-associated endonuclease Csn1